MSNIEKQVEELKTMLDNNEDFILLDVRTENEVLVSKISNKSIHIPMNEIPNRLTELDSNKEIIVEFVNISIVGDRIFIILNNKRKFN